MTTPTFDTLKFVKRLRESGFSSEQAEAISEALKDAQQSSVENLATKDDLRELELRLIKWVIGIAGAQGALIVAFMRMMK